ncbi:MAG: saccharopine dehydrogenase NADP-binding domain-containing protein [Planctomycetes bacterium]|nr:saccharopine dehydrogenase NADP-binding domain-containing protein [Planctomycetota bacterium]
MAEFLLYGATGFTGRLIAARAVELGLRPVLGGRSAWPLSGLARSLGLAHRVFGLEDPAAVDAGIGDAPLVLNCAGPFSKTARPVMEGCLRGKRHYVDITGEVDVLEGMFARDGEVKAAGVMVLPGAGFDVVPTDCLALHLKQKLPEATKLVLAVRAPTRMSPGTAATLLERMGAPGMVRRSGVLEKVEIGALRRDKPFPAMAIPWGDLATAWRSTGIPDIEVYFAAGAGERFGLAVSRIGVLAPLVRAFVRATSTGPDEGLRRRGRALVWGEVSAPDGRRCEARLETPEPYAFTVESTLAVVRRALGGEAPPGVQTPATAYGSEFVMGIEGVTRAEGAG